MYKNFIIRLFLCNTLFLAGWFCVTGVRANLFAASPAFQLTSVQESRPVKEHFFGYLKRASSGQRIVDYEVMEKPEYLFIAHYRDESIARKWEAEPLWKAIPAVKANHVYSVDSDMWARGRGLEASKIMAKQIEGFVKQK